MIRQRLAEELAEMLPGLPRVTLSAAPDDEMMLQVRWLRSIPGALVRAI